MEQKENKEVFFTKKKIAIYTTAVVVFVLFIYLFSKFVLDIDLKKTFTLISDSCNSNKRMFALWVVLLLLFPLYNTLLTFGLFMYKLNKKNIKVKIWDWLTFAGTNFFIRAITPFSIGSEPYSIYWLTRRGLTTKEATSIVASIAVVSPFIQVLITWPSFFWMCSIYGVNSVNPKWVTVFWLVFGGMIMDLFGASLMLTMSLSKKFHYYLNILINKFRKWFKMHYKTKEEIRVEFVENKAFKKMFLAELKDYKFSISLCLGNIIWNMIYYSSIIFAFNLIDSNFTSTYGVSNFELFNYVNVSITANNFIPIPGAEGTLQGLLKTLITSSSEASKKIDTAMLDNLANGGVFIWRFFSFYLTALIGIVCFIIDITKEGIFFSLKKKKMKTTNEIKITFIVIYKKNDSQMVFLNSLKNNGLFSLGSKVILVNPNDKVLKNLDKEKIDKSSYEIVNCKNGIFNLNEIKHKFNIKNNEYLYIANPDTQLTYTVMNSLCKLKNSYDVCSFNYFTIVDNKKKYIRPYKYFGNHIKIDGLKYSRKNSVGNSVFKYKMVANCEINIESNFNKELTRIIFDKSNSVKYINNNFGFVSRELHVGI